MNSPHSKDGTHGKTYILQIKRTSQLLMNGGGGNNISSQPLELHPIDIFTKIIFELLVLELNRIVPSSVSFEILKHNVHHPMYKCSCNGNCMIFQVISTINSINYVHTILIKLIIMKHLQHTSNDVKWV